MTKQDIAWKVCRKWKYRSAAPQRNLQGRVTGQFTSMRYAMNSPTPAEATLNEVSPGRRWRFVLVLVAALLISAGQPLLSELLGDRSTHDVGLTLLIMAVLLMAKEPGRLRPVALGIGLSAFATLWIGHVVGGLAGAIALVASHVLTTSLFTLMLAGIVRTVLVGRETGDALLAAVCGYLLLGIIWSLLYSAVETAAPGSFRVQSPEHTPSAPPPTADRAALGYFSFVTLSTVGYGDVTPATRVARTLAWLEAVAGQVYLAVIVAGLVGYRVSLALQQSVADVAEQASRASEPDDLST
jgi:voltage-gated potassium channel